MTSLVVEALASAGALDKASIGDSVKKLEQKISEARIEISQLIQDQYGSLLPDTLGHDVTNDIKQFCNQIDGDVEGIKTKLKAHDQAPTVSKTQLDTVRSQLAETEECLKSMDTIATIADAFQEVDFLSPNEVPYHYALLLTRADEKIKELQQNAQNSSDTVVDVRILPPLQENLVTQTENLIYELTEWWGEAFIWEANDNQHCLTVKLSNMEQDLSNQKLAALDMLQCLKQKLNQFSKNVKTFLFRPILEKSAIQVILEEPGIVDAKSRKLIIELNESTNKSPVPKDVFWNFERLFDALYQLLGQLKIGQENEEKTPDLFLTLLGDHIGTDLMQMIIDKCLKPAVPYDSEGKTEFEQVIDSANMLESRLQQIGFLPTSMSSFEKFAQNYDTLFMDRRCQKILVDGRDLIKAELHNLIEVGVEKSEKEALAELEVEFEKIFDSDQSKETLMQQPVKEIHQMVQQRLPRLFLFPKCKISSPVASLVDLLEKTIDEACESTSPKAAARLLETGRNLIELYVDLTPLQHEDKIKFIPQIAGVFYNNCYYLAHRLMTLGWESIPRLAPALGLPSQKEARITFLDFIPRLREMASECLESQLNNRRKEMENLLSEKELFTDLSDQKNLDKCDKSIRGCTLQLEQLHNVWNEVLTPTVLLKAVGSLCSHFLKTFVMKILQIDDIAAKDATHIAEIMGRTLKVLEKLFMKDDKGPSEIRRFCESPYYRSQELILCLQGSLQEISDRWCDGKGPLANWMTPNEVRHLIRALFQNTDRRANVLAKIK